MGSGWGPPPEAPSGTSHCSAAADTSSSARQAAAAVRGVATRRAARVAGDDCTQQRSASTQGETLESCEDRTENVKRSTPTQQPTIPWSSLLQ